MKRRAAVVVFAALAAIGLSLAPAGATGHRGHGPVPVVDDEHRHRSCLGTRNPFQTIQRAVDVARPGATIWICPGLYEETVKVWKPRLTHNSATARVGDKDFPGPASAIFIGVRNDRVLVHENRVHAASGNGIDVTPSAEPKQGRANARPTNITVSRNTAEHAKLAGLHVAAGTAGVAVTANTALDNTKWDCQVESTGVQNTWTANFGRTSSPARLCSPPPPPTDKPDHGKGHHHKKQHKKKKDPCVCTKHHPRAI